VGRRATAVAHSNIALVKYWGKRDAALNLPAAGSLSLTLDALTTRTTVEFDSGLAADVLRLGGIEQTGEARERVARFLDLVRARSGAADYARVDSENSFPTGSGLASSASAFAALAVAASAALGLDLSPPELSVLARRGSGSAARSILGGFVEMQAGQRADGLDAFATSILPASAWDVRMVVAVVGGGQPKSVSSRSGMDHTAATSPLYPGWLACVPGDLAEARAAIFARDLERLGAVTEASAMAMHASAFAARPAVVYFRGATLETFHAVRTLRASGAAAWATMDAGPHVKVLCAAGEVARVVDAVRAVPGVTSTITSGPGGPARLAGSQDEVHI
jgi:diphosphomevalonate decarboxylase